MCKRSDSTEKTYKNFIYRAKDYLLKHYPALKINELNEIIFNEILLFSTKNKKKYSIRTLNKYNAIIRSILNFAYQMEYTNKDSRSKFSLEKTSLIPRYIKQRDINKILEITKNLSKYYRWKAIIIFLLFTGCRVSEVSEIKVKDFDIENDLINIVKAKGNKNRKIPMYPKLKDEILLYLKKSGMAEWDPYCEGFLFARDEGTERQRMIPKRTIQHLITRIKCQAPELSYLTVHSFRHTFAVNCLKAGIEMHYLTEILGHTDPKTTMIYTKLDGEDLKNELLNKFPFPFENLLSSLMEDGNEISS